MTVECRFRIGDVRRFHNGNAQLTDEYASGPQKLTDAIAGMTPEQIDAAPVPDKWSTRQVVCHLTDFEPVYAE